MLDSGHFALVLAWTCSAYGIIAGIIGARRNNAALTSSAANSVIAVAVLSTWSLISLAEKFLNHDYRYLYVWQTSNNAMSDFYLVSAIWGGMDGSMLLWATFMAIFAAIVVLKKRTVERDVMAWVVPIISAATNFFLIVVTFLTNPFRLVPGLPELADGNGLNPLLQNPSMVIHPPALYLGFTGFVVPFSFCLAALCSGNLSYSWIRLTRRWTLISWSFLTAGIILGGHWAYIELGWGGFWAWDPVENASFLPWLTATAYLHSVMVEERRGMLRVWNVVLSIVTYLLTVFGTFLTRSGIVQSVHACADSDVGEVFLIYMIVVIIFSAVMIAYRWKDLRTEERIESYLSREAAFLFNNLVLLAICFATFWGVLFPVFSEAYTGTKSVVGPPFFNQVNVPLFLILLFLMGVGPLISWKRTSIKALRRIFLKPFIFGSFISILFFFIDFSRVYTAISFGLATFVLGTILGEFHRGMRVRKQLVDESTVVRAVNLVKRKPRRYGGFLVHLGVVVMSVAITASMAYKIEEDFILAPGGTYEVGRYRLELESMEGKDIDNYSYFRAKMRVVDKNTGEFIDYLQPERRFYYRSEEVTTEVDMRVTPREDLYLALTGLKVAQGATTQDIDFKKDSAIFKVFVNPLQLWLWVGGVIVLAGTMLVIGPAVVELGREVEPAKVRSGAAESGAEA